MFERTREIVSTSSIINLIKLSNILQHLLLYSIKRSFLFVKIYVLILEVVVFWWEYIYLGLYFDQNTFLSNFETCLYIW